jgi:chloramphenicol 3-O-phosphotransferase
MQPIYLIAGAPAVGKSTTAHAIAAHYAKSLHIPVDDVRNLVVSGLVQPGAWTPELVEQLRLARESVAHMALQYRQAGFVVTIDDFWDPNSHLQEYAILFEAPEVYKILLYPSQQAAEERNRKRAGPGEGSEYIAGGIQIVYEHLESNAVFLESQGWWVVDTTDKSVDDTVKFILAQIS